MPQIPRLPKKFPYRHVVMLFTVIVLLAMATVLDTLFMDDTPWIDLVWAAPILAAAFLLTPLEVVGVGLAAVILCLGSYVTGHETINLWASALVAIFGILTAITAALVRRRFAKLSIARDALDNSPLAFAEFSFPGYRLISFNEPYQQIMPGEITVGAPLQNVLPASAAEEMTQKMDEAVTARKRIDIHELHIPNSVGSGSYFSMSFIPVAATGRSTPRSVSLFAFDVTDAVNRTRTREAALRISAAVMSSLSLDETIRVVLDNLAFIAGTNVGALLLLEDDQWVGKAGYGDLTDEDVGSRRYPYEEVTLAVRAVESKESIVSTNPYENPLILPEKLKGLEVKSSLIVPLVSANRSIGAVVLSQTDGERQFSDEQVKFTTVIGSHGALAIENATIYENEHYVRKSLEAIEAISEAGLVSLDLDEVLTELVTRTQDVMRMDAAMILLADESEEELVARAAAGKLAKPLDEIRTRIGDGLAGRAFKEGVPMKIDNVQDFPEATDLCPFAESAGVKSVLAVPLRMGGRVAGVLQIGSQRERAFSAREWGLIQVLADRASMAVQNSLLHEATKKELARVALLRDVASACAGSHDMKRIAAEALKAVYEQLGCFRASVYYLDEERQALVSLAFLGHSVELMDQYRVSSLDQGTLLVRAVNERRMITHEEVDLTNATEAEAHILRALDVGDNRRCTVPIMYKDEVVGGMALVWPDHRRFTTAATETVLSIANLLAVAFRGCERPDFSELVVDSEAVGDWQQLQD